MPSLPGPEDHHSGLKSVYDGEEKRSRYSLRKSHKVDVVAIHGIGAWSTATWTEKSSSIPDKKVNWLKDPDMLPSQIPNSRIMIYGYESNWKGSDTIRTTARPIAERLIENLLRTRKATPNRPIIFIAHCFGGIVVMKAMVLARHAHPDLLQSVAGIVFFGTPFHGIEGALGNGRIEEYVRSHGDPVKGDILSVLRPTNHDLNDTLHDFTRIATDAVRLPTIVCFYEQKASKVWAIAGDRDAQEEIIVPMHSGCLDSANVRFAMERNHFNMNKFTGPEDSEYSMVSNQIKILAKAAPSYVDRRHRYKLDHGVPGPSRDAHPSPEASVPAHHSNDQAERDQIVDNDMSLTQSGETISQGPLFSHEDWKEEPIQQFDSKHVLWSGRLSFTKHFSRSSPYASGIAADCQHVFLLRSWQLLLFNIAANYQCEPTICHSLEPPEGREFNAAKMGVSTIATICTRKNSVKRDSCFVWNSFGQRDEAESWHRVPCENSPDEENYAYTCIAIHETREYVLVAVGMQNSTMNGAQVRVHKVDTANWDSQEMGTPFELTFTVEGRTTGSSDPAKILNFSPDGRLLICSTSRQNRILVWEISHEPEARLKQICATVRPFGAEMNAKAITAAKCWLTSSHHPYMLITTSPGSQRAQPGHEGEFSFIAPASDPFPPFESSAFHCLVEAQHRIYYSVIDGAVSDNGNAVGLVSGDGKVGIMSLQRLKKGGITSSGDAPVAIKRKLGRHLSVFEAAVRFSPDGKRLVAVDKLGNLIVAYFGGSHEQKPDD